MRHPESYKKLKIRAPMSNVGEFATLATISVVTSE